MAEYLKTHKVIDIVLTEEEGNEVFVGTRKECEEWKFEQGFGYKIVPMTLTEVYLHNNIENGRLD